MYGSILYILILANRIDFTIYFDDDQCHVNTGNLRKTPWNDIDIVGVTGSIPVAPTSLIAISDQINDNGGVVGKLPLVA